MISTHALTWRATLFAQLAHAALQFLPTPSHGGRRAPAITALPLTAFLPTPSHGGRRHLDMIYDAIEEFLPTPSHGGRQIANEFPVPDDEFLPTPSHGGRLHTSRHTAGSTHFYPRPHMEGDGVHLVLVLAVIRISTHALTWRATHPVCHQVDKRLISTHALTWRATAHSLNLIAPVFGFLPTPSHGGRR